MKRKGLGAAHINIFVRNTPKILCGSCPDSATISLHSIGFAASVFQVDFPPTGAGTFRFARLPATKWTWLQILSRRHSPNSQPQLVCFCFYKNMTALFKSLRKARSCLAFAATKTTLRWSFLCAAKGT